MKEGEGGIGGKERRWKGGKEVEDMNGLGRRDERRKKGEYTGGKGEGKVREGRGRYGERKGENIGGVREELPDTYMERFIL